MPSGLTSVSKSFSLCSTDKDSGRVQKETTSLLHRHIQAGLTNYTEEACLCVDTSLPLAIAKLPVPCIGKTSVLCMSACVQVWCARIRACAACVHACAQARVRAGTPLCACVPMCCLSACLCVRLPVLCVRLPACVHAFLHAGTCLLTRRRV